MERLTLSELDSRLRAHGIKHPSPDANVDLAELALGGGRKLFGAELVLHFDPGFGLPALRLELEGPAGREVLAIAPGPRSFALLRAALGSSGRVATDLAAVPDSGPLALLAARVLAPAADPSPALEAEEERLFARVVGAADPGIAPELLRALLDVLLEETDAERGIVALARDGVLAPAVARLRGGRDLPEPAGEVPRRVFARVVERRAAVFVEDVLDPTLSLRPSESLVARHVQSFLAAPLLEQGEVRGIVYVDRRDRPARFDARTRELFERLARRVSAVLVHALAGEAEDGAVSAGPGRSGAGLLDLVGASPPMRALFRDLQRLARQDVDVLVLGETGTGKELVARALHALGRRRDRRFEALNCAALPETLLDSTLFGHVRGAFTGADRDRKGLFAEAHGGTLFLDEVGDMPQALQAKLLRAIELGEVRPVGAAAAQRFDVRLLFATHKDLARMAGEGGLRQDLYYRLGAAATVVVPPLRERRDDIVLLARHFLSRVAERHPVAARRFAPAALERLAAHAWPGNVRELRNVVLHSALAAKGPVIEAPDLVFAGTRPPPARLAPGLGDEPIVPFRDHVREYLRRAYEAAGGNVAEMSRMLDEPRSTVRDWLARCGITPRPGRRAR